MKELDIDVNKITEMIKNKEFTHLKELLEKQNSIDIAMFFDEFEIEEILIIYRILDKEKAAEVFAELESNIQEKLINAFTDKELKNVIDELFMDDTVDLIEEMPSNVVKRILKTVNEADRKTINELLKYPEDSAGSIMTPEFIDLKENMTVKEAFEKIKKTGIMKETVYNCYVVNNNRKLLGVIDIKDLLVSETNEKIKNLMDTNVNTATTLEDQEQIAKMFEKYDLYALPVVDTENRLVGIITVDDAIDVMQEEAEEDFKKMAAISPNEDSYFNTSVFSHTKSRIAWLFVLMFSSMISGTIITEYESAFAVMPILVAFIPMLMDTGGNCGSQSSTLIIRGLATDEIKLKDFFKVLWKEMRVSIVVGIVLAIFNGIRILIQYKNPLLALTIGITIICVVFISKIIGGLLPIIAKKLKLDPAIMAAPLITTIVDICSVLIFFNIATMLFNL